MESSERPGWYQGKPIHAYVGEVRALRRAGDAGGAERLLLALIETTEHESRATGQGVTPWYYEELAELYHQQRNTPAERAILERFAQQRHALGVMPAHLLERLRRLDHTRS
jgi:hypothetical protein